ncbi:VIT domain-containing protein [Massilia suwonensis]|uniref:VIT domain-containing protein n=1 Tax=Massilia suwonensis TaxID=648895 RepID=A0ABW0MTS6_9BURK
MIASSHARLVSRNGGRTVFDGMRINGRVQGMLLELSAVLSFRNSGPEHIELVYSFPLPAEAVLLSTTVRLGERRLEGIVVEKREAGARYEDSLADGDAAIMLEQAHDGSYCLNIGNLAPGETGEITLRYAQALRFEGEGLRVCVPTVIAPRYGDPLIDAGLAPHQVPEHDVLAHYPLGLALELGRGFDGATIASPSHRIGVRSHAEGTSVSLQGDAALDRDFVLTLAGLPHASGAIAAPDPVAPGQFAVLAGFRSRHDAAAAIAVRVKILVDCSGSMAGDSIDAARKALQAAIDGFGAGDRFSLSRFGDTVEHRSHMLWKASEVSLLSARRWSNELRADLGGTEMERALSSTFALEAGMPSDVLLVSDGHIHAIDAVIAAARASQHRLFIVAIGSSPSQENLRRLASATGGAVDFVAPGEDVEAALGRMFARLRSPRLDALRLAWSSGRSAAWSSLPGAVFTDDTVHLYALVEGDAAGDELRLYGRDATGTEHEIGAAAIVTAPDDGMLARMAVHARLHCDDAPASGERTRLACAYGLVTEQTSFLLTLERVAGEKAQDMPRLQQVAQMLPAGWGGAGSVLRSGALHQPALWRRESASAAISFASNVAPYNAVPMFRKADSDLRASMPDQRPSRSLARRIAGFWRASPLPAYLSPLVLHRMLARTPCALWDRSYDELLASGLDPALVTWLRNQFGTTCLEEEVVASFLCCMAQPEMRRTLSSLPERPLLTVARLARLLRRSRPRALPAAANVDLVARMAQALAGVRADRWPPLLPLQPASADMGVTRWRKRQRAA